jgi:uncharacterized protein
MATSLYDMSVASYLQTLGAVKGFLQKGLEHLPGAGHDPDAVVEARLFDDMLPFRFQVWSVAHHSLGAVDGIKSGLFGPPKAMPEMNYADLQKVVAETIDALSKLTPAEVNALEGKDVTFKLGDFQMPYTAENFIMSFSLPNFYFHATTAYDILRTKGVPLGKRDFMGRPRLKV